MNEQQALVPTFGPAEARRLTNQAKADAEALWRKLVELYEGDAHEALGYPNWHTYCAEEFGMGRSRSYQLLGAGRVAELASQSTNGGMNERQARELAPLLRDEGEDAVVGTVRELRDEYGEQLTAEKVRAAVEKKLRPKPLAVATARPEVDRIARAGEILSQAYDNAARLVADWLEENPDEDLERACKRIAPNSWQALAARVRRRQGPKT